MIAMFAAGDKVVCPMHGAGIIEGIENREMDGESKRYYVVSLTTGNMKIMVPAEIDTPLIRAITSAEEAAKLVRSIHDMETDQNTNWSKRYRDNMDRLKSGDLWETARVYKSLIIRNREKTLSAGERKMLHCAKQILVSELTLSLEKEIEEIEDMIHNAIG